MNDDTLTVAQYGDYLDRVRAAFRSTVIVALSPFSGKHAAEIEAAVKAADDPDALYVGTAGWITPDDCTDGVHPSVEGHAKIATRLINELESRTKLTRR